LTDPQQSMLAALAEIVPKSATPALMELMTAGRIDPDQVSTALSGVDWGEHRTVIANLLTGLLPIEELVPDAYENWRPVVRDGFAFVCGHLSTERLAPKLVEQLTLPNTTSIEARLASFMKRVPSLQKLGQTIARNRYLAPELRMRLADLEDGIREVSEAEIRAEVDRQLCDALVEQQVEIETGLYAEGSVSALLRFTRRNPPPGEPATGVLKVLKPFIPVYFEEDIKVLSELAGYFDENQNRYNLDRLDLRNIVDGVRELFLRETDFEQERRSMAAAAERYRDVPDVRVPRPIDSLSTPTITAMTEERSVKVTAAFPKDRARCRAVARSLAENLAARPLFSCADLPSFHADPHAGNLRISDATGDIVVLDWALTESLSRDERRRLILLSLAIPLRDEAGIRELLEPLSAFHAADPQALLRSEVEKFIDALAVGSIPGPGTVGDLLERLLRAGVKFSSSFLIYRKMLATLGDLIEELSPGLSVDSVIAEFALKNGLPGKRPRDRDFCMPLNLADLIAIRWSMQWFLPRLLAQTLRGKARARGGA